MHRHPRCPYNARKFELQLSQYPTVQLAMADSPHHIQTSLHSPSIFGYNLHLVIYPTILLLLALLPISLIKVGKNTCYILGNCSCVLYI